MPREIARRILFLPAQSARQYYRLLSLASVVLDTPNYSTSYTGFDALGLGVPVVTLPGPYMFQRYALGLYRHMGFHDLIASSEEQYVALAVSLGVNSACRQRMCESIRQRSDALFQDEAVIREYEEFFTHSVEEERL